MKHSRQKWTGYLLFDAAFRPSFVARLRLSPRLGRIFFNKQTSNQLDAQLVIAIYVVIFTMILTVIFAMAGCTVHSELGKKAVESSSSNAVFDIAQAEELTEKTITETVEKRAFTEEPTLTTTAETGTEKVPNETIFSQTTTANTEPKQDTHTQKEMPKSEKSEPEITTNTVSEVTTAVEQGEKFDISYWISYAQNYAKSIGLIIDETATECWDNPISANANNKNIGFDIESRLNRYRNDEGFISVWIWAEKISDTQYELYIGYA